MFAFKSDSMSSLLQNYRLQCTKIIVTTKHHPLNRLKAFDTSSHRWRVFTPHPLPTICQLHTHTYTHKQTNAAQRGDKRSCHVSAVIGRQVLSRRSPKPGSISAYDNTFCPQAVSNNRISCSLCWCPTRGTRCTLLCAGWREWGIETSNHHAFVSQ